MNNNICKWGVEHQKNVLEKGKNLSRRLIKKILFSLSLLGMLFAGGNAYGAPSFPVTTPTSKDDYTNYQEINSSNNNSLILNTEEIKDTYFQGASRDGSILSFNDSNNSDLKISDSAFKSLAVDTKSGNFKNLFIDNVVVDKVGTVGWYEPSFIAAQSVSIKNLSLFGDVYDTNTKLARAKKVTIDGLYLDKGHVSVEAEEVTFKNLSFGSKPYLDYYLRL